MKQDKEEIINGMHLAYTELNKITNHVEEAINDKATPQISNPKRMRLKKMGRYIQKKNMLNKVTM